MVFILSLHWYGHRQRISTEIYKVFYCNQQNFHILPSKSVSPKLSCIFSAFLNCIFFHLFAISPIVLLIFVATELKRINNMFSRISRVHSYKSRSSTSDNFYAKESRINATRNAFSRVGFKIWNGIPSTLKRSVKKIC